MGEREKKFIKIAIDLSISGMRQNKGGPFGAIVVKGDVIIGKGYNCVLSSNDPTSHAEIVAIRQACLNLGSYQLEGCEIYTSCEPCPMCLGAIYWARADKIYYANTRLDAKQIGFDDSLIYEEMGKKLAERVIPIIRIDEPQAKEAFEEWQNKSDKNTY